MGIYLNPPSDEFYNAVLSTYILDFLTALL